MCARRRSSSANNIVSGLVQYLTVKGVKISGPDDTPMDLGESFLTYLKGRDTTHPTVLSVETQRHYYGTFKKVVLALHEMDPRWKVIRIPPKPFAGLPRKSKPKELDRAAWANVMKAAVEECIAYATFAAQSSRWDKENLEINPDAVAARRDPRSSDPDVQQRLWDKVHCDHCNDEAPQSFVPDRAQNG